LEASSEAISRHGSARPATDALACIPFTGVYAISCTIWPGYDTFGIDDAITATTAIIYTSDVAACPMLPRGCG